MNFLKLNLHRIEGDMLTKTYAEINEKIKNGSAVVLTAEEMIGFVSYWGFAVVTLVSCLFVGDGIVRRVFVVVVLVSHSFVIG